MKIGLSMVVKGSLDYIGPCLKSQLGFADCFSIAVDPRPEDDEVFELCRSIVGDGAYRQEWPNNYSVARNLSLGHLLEHHPDVDYVYWMDSDDICHSDLAVIKRRVEDVQPDHVVGMYQYSPHLIHERVRMWRVVDGRSTRVWVGPIHDCDFQIFDSGGPAVKWDDWVVTHVREHRDPESHFKTIEIGEASLAIAPDDLRTLFYVAREYSFVGYYEDAIRCFKSYLERSHNVPERYQALIDLAMIHVTIKAPERSIELLSEAVDLMPNVPFAAVRMADVYRESESFERAEYWYKYALECKDFNCLFDWTYMRTTYAAKWLAFVMCKLGRPEKEWRYYDNLYEE